MRVFRTIVVLAAVTLASTSCGGIGDGGATEGPGQVDRIDHPSGPDEVVLRVGFEGGFVPVEMMLSRLPSWTLYGDGAVIVEGPQIEIYPPPALPNLLVTRLSDDGIQTILEAARDAGLMGGDATYPYPCIADAPTTVFTTTADGGTNVVSAYALDATGPCPDVDEEPRAALRDFQMRLGDLTSWLPSGSVGAEEFFTPSGIRLYVTAYQPDPNLDQQGVEWPLSGPLSTFGEPVEGTAGDLRCGVVDGADLDLLLPELEQANTLTPWVSEGEEYRLIARPLLPDERGC